MTACRGARGDPPTLNYQLGNSLVVRHTIDVVPLTILPGWSGTGSPRT
jgi:hypothetical protein